MANKSVPIRIVGDTALIDKYLTVYCEQKAIVESAELAKKEASMAVLNIENNAGTYLTNKYQFTVVGSYEVENVSVKDIKENCPEIYQVLLDKGLVKTRQSAVYITGIKEPKKD